MSHLHFYRWDEGLFRLPTCPNRGITTARCHWGAGELTMSDTEKAKSEKPETRPTDDGYLSPTPTKKKIVEPVVSQASHYS